MLRITSIITLLITLSFVVNAQSINGFSEDETNLYAMNKQVGQFIHRFNMEEDKYGKLLSQDDSLYHNNRLREKLLPGIFDKYNPRTSGNLKKYFIEDITNKKHPVYLNFLDNNWFAEVAATFTTNNGVEKKIILFLTVEEENLGSKWVLSNVYYSEFHKMFPKIDSVNQKKFFLHPQSHELDFMNLNKVFENPQQIEYYATTDYQPDYLTLFFYLIKEGVIKFKQIDGVKFHFFQIKNWYFELSYYNRNDSNSGWLISNLKYINDKDKSELIKTYNICAN